MPSGTAISFDLRNAPEKPLSQLRVRGFGRIKSAEIDLVPLTILVGKNNTGKSYLASLLWAFRSSYWLFARPGYEALKAPKAFVDSVNKLVPGGGETFQIEADSIERNVNQWLRSNRNKFVQDLLSFEGASVRSIELAFSGQVWLSKLKGMPSWIRESGFQDADVQSWGVSTADHSVGEDGPTSMLFGGAVENPIDFLYSQIVDTLSGQSYRSGHGSAMYIPAARTGLILSIRELYSSLTENLGIRPQENASGKFSRPTINFLRSLVGDQGSPPNTVRVADFIERTILQGKIERRKDRVPSFEYRPTGKRAVLPIHAVSSMVTELTPILDVLRRSHFGGGLIIEEPEAHLHLSAQRCMARAIAKLVNIGIPVVVTTHSDTFVQQLNLLIRLHGHENRSELMAELGYDDDEIINPAEVEAYEFMDEGDGTVVQKASKENGALVIKSLNESLFELAEDVISLGDY